MARIGSLNILSEGLSQEDFNAKLGAQTCGGIAIGQGPNNPLAWTAPLDGGQVLVGTSLLNCALPVPTTIQGIGGITVNSSSGSIVISGTSSGFSWHTASGPTLVEPDNGYVAIGGSTVAFTLDAAAFGQSVSIVGNNTPWTIAGGTINFLSSPATSSLSSTTGYDVVTLLCVAAPSTWVVTPSMGNIGQ